MFGALIALQQSMREIQLDKAFEETMVALPPDVAHRMLTERIAEKAATQERDAVERRHRELCDAIRSAGFRF